MDQNTDICSSSLFESIFKNQQNAVYKLGTDSHINAKKEGNFINWSDIYKISENILPFGKENYTTKVFKSLLEMDSEKRKKNDWSNKQNYAKGRNKSNE